MVILDGQHLSLSESEEEPSTLGADETHNGGQRQKRRHSQYNRRNNVDDIPEFFLRMLLETTKRLWVHVKRASNFVMVDLGGYQLFDRTVQWCIQNPHIAICVLAASLVTFLPFLLLVGFGLSTILMTFTGFLVLEGTLLTILTMMLFGLLGALVIVLLFFAVVGVAAYFGFARIYDLYGNVESHKSAIKTFLQKENQTTPSRGRSSNRTENSREERVN